MKESYHFEHDRDIPILPSRYLSPNQTKKSWQMLTEEDNDVFITQWRGHAYISSRSLIQMHT